MIPADHIAFDGDTAWWIVRKCPEPRGQQSIHTDCEVGARILDRPCDTCDGTRTVRVDHWRGHKVTNRCPDCIEGGRHTWEIEVACPDPDCPHCTAGGPLKRLRVSVVPGMVLPISLVEPALPCVTMEGFVIPEGERIALPPVAATGMWAVQLRWEELVS